MLSLKTFQSWGAVWRDILIKAGVPVQSSIDYCGINSIFQRLMMMSLSLPPKAAHVYFNLSKKRCLPSTGSRPFCRAPHWQALFVFTGWSDWLNRDGTSFENLSRAGLGRLRRCRVGSIVDQLDLRKKGDQSKTPQERHQRRIELEAGVPVTVSRISRDSPRRWSSACPAPCHRSCPWPRPGSRPPTSRRRRACCRCRPPCRAAPSRSPPPGSPPWRAAHHRPSSSCCCRCWWSGGGRGGSDDHQNRFNNVKAGL